MGYVLHARARTTPEVRREMRHSQESLIALSKRYGVNPKTIEKWRKRSFVHDVLMGPKVVRSTSLTPMEEAVAGGGGGGDNEKNKNGGGNKSGGNGEGEIIVRDAPDADLSGLNRNPADALRTETLRDVAVAVDAVKYIDIGLDRKQNTNYFDGALRFVHDPVTFFKDLLADEKQPAIPAARPAAAEGGE